MAKEPVSVVDEGYKGPSLKGAPIEVPTVSLEMTKVYDFNKGQSKNG